MRKHLIIKGCVLSGWVLFVSLATLLSPAGSYKITIPAGIFIFAGIALALDKITENVYLTEFEERDVNQLVERAMEEHDNSYQNYWDGSEYESSENSVSESSLSESSLSESSLARPEHSFINADRNVGLTLEEAAEAMRSLVSDNIIIETSNNYQTRYSLEEMQNYIERLKEENIKKELENKILKQKIMETSNTVDEFGDDNQEDKKPRDIDV
jgi:hypothetical protein